MYFFMLFFFLYLYSFFYIAFGSSKKIKESNTRSEYESSLSAIGFCSVVATVFSITFFVCVYDAIKAIVAPNLILQKHHIVTESK